jgi:anti-sigma-K factor RskA
MSAEIHALSGAYAVDALSAEERAEFEEHLATCAACRDEVDSLRATAALLGGTLASDSSATQPSASVRDAVLAGIGQIRPLPPLADPVEVPDNVVPLRRRWLTGLVAAAAVVATLGVGATVWHPWDETSQVSLADSVLSAGDAIRSTSTIGGAEVTLVRSPSLGQAVLVADSLPVPAEGKVYQLWLQNPAGQMVSAGLLPRQSSQKYLLTGNARDALAAGVTLEPTGGSDEPTTAPLTLFEFGAPT